MPEYIITIHWPVGPEYRCGADTRHTKRILAGLKGRYPRTRVTVLRVLATEDVTSDFA